MLRRYRRSTRTSLRRTRRRPGHAVEIAQDTVTLGCGGRNIGLDVPGAERLHHRHQCHGSVCGTANPEARPRPAATRRTHCQACLAYPGSPLNGDEPRPSMGDSIVRTAVRRRNSWVRPTNGMESARLGTAPSPLVDRDRRDPAFHLNRTQRLVAVPATSGPPVSSPTTT